jgi:hypothetical protein
VIAFRVGAEDAEFLEKEFLPEFTAQDLVNLAKYNVYLKLMINGVTGRPFSAETLPPFPKPTKSNKEKIIRVSRERYGVPRRIIEEKIARWSKVIEEPKETKKPKTITLGEALKTVPVSFSSKPGKKEKTKREIKVEELKKAIERALEKKNEKT